MEAKTAVRALLPVQGVRKDSVSGPGNRQTFCGMILIDDYLRGVQRVISVRSGPRFGARGPNQNWHVNCAVRRL